MPEYRFIEWNEDNFDVRACPYVERAYRAREFAFVSDYARGKALYDHGGIYLDTDVEVLKPFDDLLSYRSFWGFEAGNFIAAGARQEALRSNGNPGRLGTAFRAYLTPFRISHGRRGGRSPSRKRW